MSMHPGREYVGIWETDAPLTVDEWEADKPLLEALLKDLPKEVTIRTLTVWVHGREYDYRRLDVTTL